MGLFDRMRGRRVAGGSSPGRRGTLDREGLLMDLPARWPGSGPLGAELLRRYAEPHRRYHTTEHLAAVLDHVDELAGGAHVGLDGLARRRIRQIAELHGRHRREPEQEVAEAGARFWLFSHDAMLA